ncbi:MAG: EscU/YscU/HrcU family type III secretion system export apparatus switch protein [Pseudomonadota bacterium]
MSTPAKGRAPERLAVALRYDDGQGAPTVVASGRAGLAERIIDVAVTHQVPLHDDPALAALLAKAPAGTAIPAEAYVAVAQVLAFLHHLDAVMAHESGNAP